MLELEDRHALSFQEKKKLPAGNPFPCWQSVPYKQIVINPPEV
jgi:hypothetical protein